MPIRVVACVIERDGKLLLCRRPTHKRHGGLWEFPGGKVENGESDLDAGRRELKEELDLTLVHMGPPDYTFEDGPTDLEISFFAVTAEGDPRRFEHEEIAWKSPSEALALDLAPGDEEYLERCRIARSFYSAAVPAFVTTDPLKIVGSLTSAAAEAGYAQQLHTQTVSWDDEVRALQDALRGSRPLQPAQVILEYRIPRRGKRPDAVVVLGDRVVVIEFKREADRPLRSYEDQVVDYCLDLRDFHSSSRGCTLIPVVLVPRSEAFCDQLPAPVDFVTPAVITGASRLRSTLEASFRGAGPGVHPPEEWANGSYAPTPTIVDAARQLYAKMDVREIARSHAGAENLAETAQALQVAIKEARDQNRKFVCFVTGVPGAGKTLAGLNVVHNSVAHEEGELAVFLSGNGPLVEVLREALARDESRRLDIPIREPRRRAATFIQNVHDFLDAYIGSKTPPPENVVVFDEAQRAWSKDHWLRKMKRRISLRRRGTVSPALLQRLTAPASEPELLLEIMDRRPGWAVVVALIGGGQEINTGEAGLREWGNVIASEFQDWTILVSKELLEGHHSTGGATLFSAVPANVDVISDEALHLRVSLRSYRAEKLSEWVSLVLDGDSTAAASIANVFLGDYPLVITRSLKDARDWLRTQRRGSRRAGMIATSEARRLRQHGFDVTAPLDVKKWFLAPSDHVSSSSFLELAATEFAVQGLEVDWACVCWDCDVRWMGAGWSYHRFRGTKWQAVHKTRTREFMLNKYRVLLTRAREGLVIWVPRGSLVDNTRRPGYYQPVAEYLRACGVRDLSAAEVRERAHRLSIPL